MKAIRPPNQSPGIPATLDPMPPVGIGGGEPWRVFGPAGTVQEFDTEAACRATNKMRGALPRLECSPKLNSLPHLICSRPMFHRRGQG